MDGLERMDGEPQDPEQPSLLLETGQLRIRLPDLVGEVDKSVPHHKARKFLSIT